MSNDLESTIACFDDLFADWGTISTRLLYGKCRERGIKVVLVGEGADELFGGYDVFRSSASRAPTDWWLFQLYRHYCGRRYGRNREGRGNDQGPKVQGPRKSPITNPER